jgi:hypothetical protein
MIDHAIFSRHSSASTMLRIVVASGLGNMAVAAFFPVDDYELQVLTSFFTTAISAMLIHITWAEWGRRPNQDDLQTNVRRAVCISSACVVIMIAAALAAGFRRKRPLIRPWTAARLMYAEIGVLDLMHTLWLQWSFARMPPEVQKAFFGDYIGGRRDGPPSVALGLWLITMAAVLNERVRRFIAHASGGDKLRMHLGQLTQSEVQHLLPGLRAAESSSESEANLCSRATSSQRSSPLRRRSPTASNCSASERPPEPSSRLAVAGAHRTPCSIGSEQSEHSQESASSSAPWSWSSYGHQWLTDWPEWRERGPRARDRY